MPRASFFFWRALRLAMRIVVAPFAALGRALRRTWNSAASVVLRTRGRWRLRRGDPESAAVYLEAAAARSPDAFGPLLDLTRAHLRRRDLLRARRALARAREVSPLRFAREASAAMRAEGFDLATLADVSVPGRTEVTGVGERAERTERGTAVLESAVRVRAAPLGDCRDIDEYTRFQCMPPITPAEIAATDWDSVFEDLLDN